MLVDIGIEGGESEGAIAAPKFSAFLCFGQVGTGKTGKMLDKLAPNCLNFGI